MIVKLTVVVWLLLVHAIALLAIFDTDLLYRIDRKLGTGLLNPAEISAFYENMLGSHLQLDSSVEEGSVIFFGDSITQGLNVAAVTHPAINYGIGMDTSFGLLQRIPQYDSLAKASQFVVAIGVNDLIRTSRDDAGILENYRLILDSLPRSVPVIIQAIFPVDERLVTAGFNQRIRGLNASLKELAEQRKLVFLDLHEAATDAEGNLKAELHVGDGLHLSGAGYKLWIDALKKQHFTDKNSNSQ